MQWKRDESAVSYISYDPSRRVFHGIGRFETNYGLYEKDWATDWFGKKLVIYGEQVGHKDS